MVKPQTTLENTLDEYHSLDRFDSSRRDVIKSIVDEVFLVEIAYDSHERAYAYNADTRFRDGQSVYGSIANSEHQLVVQLPADMNETVSGCSPGDTIQVVLSPIKWDSAYDRLACIAVLDVEPVVDEAGEDTASNEGPDPVEETVDATTEDVTEEQAEGQVEAPAEDDAEDEVTHDTPDTDESLSHDDEQGDDDDDDEIELELAPEDEEEKEEEENDATSQLEEPASSDTETAEPDEPVEEADPVQVEPPQAVEVEQFRTSAQTQRERFRSADQDSRELVIPHEDKKAWKDKADKFFKDLKVADTNKGLLIASGVLVFISFGLMITCYILSCITATYIIEDVNELGTESRFPDKVYRLAKIQLWAGAGMLAMLIASAIHD